MSEPVGGPLAVDLEGRVVALGEGSDILAYNVSDEAPAWISERPAAVLGIVAVGAEIVSLDAEGRVVGHDPQTGEVRWEQGPFGAGGKLGASLDGLWAAAVGMAVHIGRGNAVVRTIALGDPAVVAVAFSGDVPAVGYADGRIRMFPEGADAITRQAFEPLTDLASDTDAVLMTGDTHMGRMPPEGKGSVMVSYGDGLTGVVRSASGAIHAVRVGDRYVAAHGNEGADDLGMLRYVDRVAGGMAIDPTGCLWVACGEGHANKLDLTKASSMSRTDAHPGRPQSSWLVRMSTSVQEDGETPPAVQEERELASAKAMPLWTRILLSVFAIVAVLGGWIGLIYLLGD